MQVRLLKEYLRERTQRSLPATTRLRDAAFELMTSECDVLAVTRDNATLLGVITESAVVRCLLSNPPSTMTIEPLIQAHVESVRMTTPLSSVLPLFRSSCHTAIPVVDDEDRYCGMLLRRDVMGSMLQDAASRSEEASAVTDGGTPKTVEIPNATAPVIRDHAAPRSLSSAARIDQPQTAAPPASASQSAENRQSRPHFLTGDEARRRLDSVSEFRGGFNENPW